MRRVLPLVVAALISCTNKPAEGTLKVVVDVSDTSLTSRCTKLFARGSTELITDPLDITDKDRVVVAIYQGMQTSEIELEAIGYSDADCLNETVPSERTEKMRQAFGMPAEITLVMKRANISSDGGIDADGDGVPLPADCNDNDPAIKPGATERCDDQLDNDCNERVDCADTTVCDNQQCGSGALCANARCTETICNDGLDNNQAGGTDCFDPDCDARPCMNGGVCEFGGCRATSEVGLCGDGIDNDGDDAGDCSDLVDCPMGATCDDQNGCTTTGTCDGVGSCVTQPISCDVVPQCFTGGGACDVDAGRCPFVLNTDNTCSDGLRCTTLDFCLGDGGCGGNATVCNSPPNTTCFTSVGMCSEALDGGCVYTPTAANQTSCDDGDECTDNDSCDGDGGCRGIAPLPSDCPPSECMTRDAGACATGNRCGFTPLPNGSTCNNGICSGGQCVTAPVFNFPTSNFVEADLPASLGAVNINCSTATINTALADGGVNFVNCDGGLRLAPWTVVPNGGNEAVLLYMDSLTISTTTSRLRARGARPVILAVKGNVTITGKLDVNGFEGTAASRGAGSNTNCGLGTGRPGGIGGNPITAGGGGGGGFGTLGGRGHFGEGGGNFLGGDGGALIGTAALIPLVGGCSGGNGGSANDMNFGRGGRGGGALQITSGGVIHITGDITANGGGGEGGAAAARTGGGGGGSGGAILLEAVRLTSATSANVIANGGGAGEGSGVSGDGEPGENGTPNLFVALGGSTSACGGSGGNGAASTTNATNGGAPTCNTNMPGGGGGGGLGRIRVNGHDGGCGFASGMWFSPARTGVGTGCQ